VSLSYDKNQDIVGALTYHLRKKYGLTFILMPPLTPACGVWIHPNSISNAENITKELISQIPKVDYTSLKLSPMTDCLCQSTELGFQTKTNYTYILHNIKDTEWIFSNFLPKIRNHISKTKINLEVLETENILDFLTINDLVFEQKGMKNPVSKQIWDTLDNALSTQKKRKIFLAIDKHTQEKVACLYLIWDNQKAYFLAGGSKREPVATGSMYLLFYTAIQFAASKVDCFDFEGSMIQSVERYFRDFNGELSPYYTLTRSKNKMIPFLLKYAK
jgi:hypothetical protein